MEIALSEIDKYKFGKRKCKREQFVDGKWVFGGIERGTDKYFMVVVHERLKNVLINVIREHCWHVYKC